MHGMNDLDLWRLHREELIREAKNGRLARRSWAAERPKKAPRFEGGLLESVRARLTSRKGAPQW